MTRIIVANCDIVSLDDEIWIITVDNCDIVCLKGPITRVALTINHNLVTISRDLRRDLLYFYFYLFLFI